MRKGPRKEKVINSNRENPTSSHHFEKHLNKEAAFVIHPCGLVGLQIDVPFVLSDPHCLVFSFCCITRFNLSFRLVWKATSWQISVCENMRVTLYFTEYAWLTVKLITIIFKWTNL